MNYKEYSQLISDKFPELRPNNIVSRELLEKLWREDRNHNLPYHYPYIPLEHSTFFKLIKIVHKHFPHNKSFVDIGSGIGDKVYGAYTLGFFNNITGIEYSDYTYQISKERLRECEIKLIHSNAFDINFSQFDIIYMYHPIDDRDLMRELYFKLFNEMKKGAIISAYCAWGFMEKEDYEGMDRKAYDNFEILVKR